MRSIRAATLYVLRVVRSSFVIRSVLDCSRVHWSRAFLFVFSNAVGGLMPLWGALFLLRLHRTPFRWVDFSRHGEFGLYAAAFLATSIYQILMSIRRNESPLQAGSVLVGLAGILLAAFIYAGTNPQLSANASVGSGAIDEHYLMVCSTLLLLFAVVYSFFVTLIDASLNEPDLGAADETGQAIMRAALTIERPERASASADAPAEPRPLEVPTNDELRQQFNVERAEEGPADEPGDPLNG